MNLVKEKFGRLTFLPCVCFASYTPAQLPKLIF